MSHTENLNQTWQSHLELLGLGHAVDLILLSPHVSVALGLGTLPGDNLLGAHLLPHHEPASDRPAHAQGCGTCPTETRAPWPVVSYVLGLIQDGDQRGSLFWSSCSCLNI